MLSSAYSLPQPQKMTPNATASVAIGDEVDRAVTHVGWSDVTAELMMLTPFAGANRSRFKGLRLLRTLSALCVALPCRGCLHHTRGRTWIP